MKNVIVMLAVLVVAGCSGAVVTPAMEQQVPTLPEPFDASQVATTEEVSADVEAVDSVSGASQQVAEEETAAVQEVVAHEENTAVEEVQHSPAVQEVVTKHCKEDKIRYYRETFYKNVPEHIFVRYNLPSVVKQAEAEC